MLVNISINLKLPTIYVVLYNIMYLTLLKVFLQYMSIDKQVSLQQGVQTCDPMEEIWDSISACLWSKSSALIKCLGGSLLVRRGCIESGSRGGEVMRIDNINNNNWNINVITGVCNCKKKLYT